MTEYEIVQLLRVRHLSTDSNCARLQGVVYMSNKEPRGDWRMFWSISKDSDFSVRFCPFCGKALPVSMDEIDAQSHGELC